MMLWVRTSDRFGRRRNVSPSLRTRFSDETGFFSVSPRSSRGGGYFGPEGAGGAVWRCFSLRMLMNQLLSRQFTCLVALMGLAIFSGCGDSLPPLVPVSG